MTWQRFRMEAAATLRLGGPLIAAQLAQISMGFVDAVMAGRLSAKDLAAVAVGANVFWPISFAFASVGIAVSPTVAHHYGAGQRRNIGHSVRQGLWLATVLSVGAFLALRSTPSLLRLAQISPELIPTTTGFLQAISWGVPGLCIFQVLRCYSEGISRTHAVMYTSILSLFGNIIGDYLLMYGKLGLPKLGAIGCGVASAIIMWMNALLMIVLILLNEEYAPDAIFTKLELPHWAEIRTLAKLGIPMSASWFMEASLFAVVALLMGRMGTTVVAGHQIAINVASITFMVPLGIAMAITVRVGQAAGRGDIESARIAGFTGIAIAAAFMACAAIGMASFPGLIARIYTNEPDVQQMGITLLYLAAIFQISDGLQVAAAGALRGLKDTKVPMVITAIAYWLVAIPLGYLLGIVLDGGPKALWIGIICGLFVAALLLNLRFHLTTRSYRRRSPAIPR